MFPTPVDPSALFMMGAAGMGRQRPRRFVQRLFDQAQPEEDLYEPQERGETPPEFEGYIDPASIAALLKGARRDAIAQGMIGAGASLIGAEDLSTGLAEGAKAFASPFFQYKDLERQLPIEMAGKRYELAGIEQQRERERNLMGMKNRLFDFDVSEGEFTKGTRGLRREGMKLENAINRTGLRGARTRLNYLVGELEDAATARGLNMDVLREDLDFLRRSFMDRIQAIRSGNYATEAGARRDVLDAGLGGRSRGGYGGLYDDVTLSQIRANMSSAITDADQQIQSGRLSGASPMIQEGFKLKRQFDSLENVPVPIALEMMPTARIVSKVQADIHSGRYTPQQLAEKYKNDPTAYRVLAYFLWDREKEMPPSAP